MGRDQNGPVYLLTLAPEWFLCFGVIDCEPEFISNSLLLNLFDLDDSWVLRTVPCHSKQSTAIVVMMRATQVHKKKLLNLFDLIC